MKKFFTLSLICLLLTGIFIPSGVVRATEFSDCVAQGIKFGGTQADSEAGCTGKVGDPQTTTGTCTLSVNSKSTNITQAECAKATGGKGAWTPDDPNAGPGNTGTTDKSSSSCSPLNFNIKNCFGSMLEVIGYFILTLMAWLLWLAGLLLNLVLNETIIKMSANITSMTGINIAWKVIRDVLNIGFIFILVFEGIKIILSISDKDKAKQIIGGIVMTALLINFSMFFTKIIIDASNIATIGFYKSLSGGQSSVTVNSKVIPDGITGSFANALHITSLYDSNSTQTNTTLKITVYLLGALLFFVLSFVFFAISMMFIIRYIVLIFLLMFSPLGFIGFGLPQLKSKQSEWWTTLIGQCIFAPLYMFMTWVILTLISSEGFIPKGGSLADLTNAGANSDAQMGAIGLILNFVVIIGLAVMSLVLSKQYASQGSKYIGEATEKLTAATGGVLLGGAAHLGRNYIGGAALRNTNIEELEARAAQGDTGAAQA